MEHHSLTYPRGHGVSLYRTVWTTPYCPVDYPYYTVYPRGHGVSLYRTLWMTPTTLCTPVGTAFHRTVLVTAHCPALKNWRLHCSVFQL